MSRASTALVCGLLATLAAGCEPGTSGTCAASPEEVWIVDSLAFGRIEDGISEGFDLDRRVTAQCGVRDYVDASGLAGIDNALGVLLPVVESQAVGGTRLDYLLQDSIASGQILLAFELGGVDAHDADGCVGVRMRRLTGDPLLGADNRLLGGQTLYADTAAPISELGTTSLRLVAGADGASAGTLETQPAEIVLPVSILDARFTLTLRGAQLRFRYLGDGRAEGVIAGGVDIEEILAVVATLNIGEALMTTAERLVRSGADLTQVSGDCTELSAVLTFTAVRGFVGE